MALPAASPYRSVPYRSALSRVVVPWWAVLVTLIGLGMMFLVLQENGVLLASQAQVLHEFFHDGRHALGVPCH